MARSAARTGIAETYRYSESDLALRPEVGTQPQFRKCKPPATYRYASLLSPAASLPRMYNLRLPNLLLINAPFGRKAHVH
jgi:hypothetical protein